MQEHGNRQSGGQAEDKVLGLGAQSWPQERIRQTPANSEVACGLARHLLQLLRVERFHLDDLPFGQVVILEYSKRDQVECSGS